MLTDTWHYFRYLETEPGARKQLALHYRKQGREAPERLSFQQCTRLLYTIRQARSCYETARSSDPLLRPLLLFYGCTHLLKALILFRDPFYPQNSRVLQHGVTSRKAKKQPYHLLDDEVRPQKEGLFSHLAKLLGALPLSERYSMRQLFSWVPELAADYTEVVERSKWVLLQVGQQNAPADVLCFPADVKEGVLRLSMETFGSFLQRHARSPIPFIPLPDQGSASHPMCFHVPAGSADMLFSHPLLYRSVDGAVWFWNEEDSFPIPAWSVHFLILYILGMLCRYEAECWGDLVSSHAYAEWYLVERFLDTHQAIFPDLVFELIHQS